jgi:electron transport complex protein RnfD
MRDVLIALAPALITSVVVFGVRALIVTLVCAATCVVCEWGFEKLMKRDNTAGDLSAVVTGVLLAYNLPVGIPIWQAIFGSAVAIVLVKQLFGGIGKNFANPAITARIVMFLGFAGTMSTFVLPDAVSGATPLALLASGQTALLPSIPDMLFGFRGGSLGETGTVALALGGVYLLIRRVISWQTPVTFIATVALLSWLFGGDPVYNVLSGGLVLGAIFMATDYVTTPQTSWGRVIFGVGAGALTVVLRFYGSYPEGVSFAILLMNILTPYINKATRRRPLGGVKS